MMMMMADLIKSWIFMVRVEWWDRWVDVTVQPTIREAAVAALRAALVITSQREGKQKENPTYYKVVSLSHFVLVFLINLCVMLDTLPAVLKSTGDVKRILNIQNIWIWFWHARNTWHQSIPSDRFSIHPSVGRRSEYRPKGGDALRLGVKADMVLFVGNTVWSICEHVRGVCVDVRYKSTYNLL